MLKSKILIIFATALLFVGCFFDEAYDTEYRLKNLVQAATGDDGESLSGVVLYAFEGDAEDWGARSYEDALQGVAYDESTGELLTPFAVGVTDVDNPETVSVRLNCESVMLLAVDTVNQIFATSNYSVGLNLSTTYVTLLWRPWKDSSYSEGSWYFDHSQAVATSTE
ncbi:MAG: hypothetical protein SNJ33_05400 [Rikenellaceae bacterium]